MGTRLAPLGRLDDGELLAVLAVMVDAVVEVRLITRGYAGLGADSVGWVAAGMAADAVGMVGARGDVGATAAGTARAAGKGIRG